MNTLLNFWYGALGSWAFVVGHKTLLCWAVCKAGQKSLSNTDALFWFISLAQMKLKHPSPTFLERFTRALTTLPYHIDQSSDRFCYALSFLSEAPQKHEILLKIYPSLQMSPMAQTFFFSTLCHSEKFKALPKDVQDNLFIQLFDMANIEPFIPLTEVDRQVGKKTNTLAIGFDTYNLFLSLARNLPEKSFCHLLSNTEYLPPSITLLSVLPPKKTVCDILVRRHPQFVFQSLLQYAPAPTWQKAPFLPQTHAVLLEVRHPLLGQLYQNSCLEHEAQTQKQDILNNITPSSHVMQQRRM